jgi:acetoacetate decarboxylase
MGEERDFFSSIQYEEILVGERYLSFPVKYIEQTRISATFEASTREVREMLPSKKLEPVEIGKGLTTVTLMACEYKKIDALAQYNELFSFTPVVYSSDENENRKEGIYVFHMPVTTEEACQGGIILYGFPKFVADIEFKDLGDSVFCELSVDGGTVLTLTAKKLDAREVARSIYTFTKKEGHLIHTLVQSLGMVGTSRDSDGASLTLGDHEMVEDLLKMGMGKSAIESSYVPEMMSLLHKPGECLVL